MNARFVLLLFLPIISSIDMKYLVNFTEKGTDVSEWYEVTDTVRTEGKSKASFVIQESEIFQRAILFALLNPQPCGAAFAGFSISRPLNLTLYNKISLKVRGQGQFTGWKFILRQIGEKSHFCDFFEAPNDFQVITLNLSDFKPYFEGHLVDNSSIKLEKDNIISFGLQTYGGVYMPKKQSGVASLEVDWIRVE